jgi:hypothetical protein
VHRLEKNGASDLGFEELVWEGQKADKKPSSFSVSQFPNELFHSRTSTPLGIAVVSTSERNLGECCRAAEKVSGDVAV